MELLLRLVFIYNIFRQREHFCEFYTALLLDVENNCKHIHMEKLLEQPPDVSDLVQ